MEEKRGMFKKIIKPILIVIAVILAVFLVIVIRRVSILNNLLAKAEKSEQLTNYYMLTTSTDGVKTQVWSKDDTHYLIIINGNIGDVIIYQNGEEELKVSEAMGQKIVRKGAGRIQLITFKNYMIPEDIWKTAISTSISSKEYEGKDCYEMKLKYFGTVMIEKETGILAKHGEGEFLYKLNCVTDADIQRPDITGYELQEN